MFANIYVWSQVYVALYWLYILLISEEGKKVIEECRSKISDNQTIMLVTSVIVFSLVVAPIAVLFQWTEWIVGKLVRQPK